MFFETKDLFVLVVGRFELKKKKKKKKKKKNSKVGWHISITKTVLTT